MTAQTTTQRTAKHRLAVKERMARMTEALTEIAECHPGWIADNPEWALEIAQKALNPTDPAGTP